MSRLLNELRHGNWIVYLGSEIAIRDVEMIELCSGVGNPKPIFLNQEWLLKFGFKNTFLSLEDGQTIQVEGDTFYLFGVDSATSGQCFSNKIQFVHQLQNLYFALTGDELQLNR